MTSQTPLENLEGVCVQLLMAGSIAHHGLRRGSSAFFLCWSLKLLESKLDSDDRWLQQDFAVVGPTLGINLLELEAKMYKKAAGKKFQQALFHCTFSNSFL